MKIWWVTASERAEGKWHWRKFFEDASGDYEWGGPEWIRSTISYARIKRMKKGHVLIAYQAGEGVIGLATLAREGYRYEGGKNFDCFDLASKPLLRLAIPIPLDAIKLVPHAYNNFEFLRVRRGSVLGAELKGLQRLVGLMLAFNPQQSAQISSFLRLAGVALPYRLSKRR